MPRWIIKLTWIGVEPFHVGQVPAATVVLISFNLVRRALIAVLTSASFGVSAATALPMSAVAVPIAVAARGVVAVPNNRLS